MLGFGRGQQIKEYPTYMLSTSIGGTDIGDLVPRGP